MRQVAHFSLWLVLTGAIALAAIVFVASITHATDLDTAVPAMLASAVILVAALLAMDALYRRRASQQPG